MAKKSAKEQRQARGYVDILGGPVQKYKLPKAKKSGALGFPQASWDGFGASIGIVGAAAGIAKAGGALNKFAKNLKK